METIFGESGWQAKGRMGCASIPLPQAQREVLQEGHAALTLRAQSLSQRQVCEGLGMGEGGQERRLHRGH